VSVRGISLLGATGSIGQSALEVIGRHPDRFRLVAATANHRVDALQRVVAEHAPLLAVVAGGGGPTGAPWAEGEEALIAAATHPRAHIVLNALVGAAGLGPTLAGLRAGKRMALANKESLVCGGELVLQAAREGGGELVPVDSEHSAVLQCIAGRPEGEVRRIILTASGGPFRQLPAERLEQVTPEDALRHPTWSMGSKVTIDSATLANKALEVIEAHHLFGVPMSRIEVVVHPQSIVHSMVEFVDGSVVAQLGFPTMELPILYAFTHPERISDPGTPFDPIAASPLTFEAVRRDSFPAFALGIEAGERGGTHPAVFNAANEVAVEAFLRGRLSFPGIGRVIAGALESWEGAPLEDVESVLHADAWARAHAETHIGEHAPC
jgi:1-deoxy-D-xylulose-5-phosphate reductoisomerase